MLLLQLCEGHPRLRLHLCVLHLLLCLHWRLRSRRSMRRRQRGADAASTAGVVAGWGGRRSGIGQPLNGRVVSHVSQALSHALSRARAAIHFSIHFPSTRRGRTRC
jgi:hypothetical protein